MAKFNCCRLSLLESYNKLIKHRTLFAVYCETFILAFPAKQNFAYPVNFRFVRSPGKKRFRCCKAEGSYAFSCLVYVYIHTNSLPLEHTTHLSHSLSNSVKKFVVIKRKSKKKVTNECLRPRHFTQQISRRLIRCNRPEDKQPKQFQH